MEFCKPNFLDTTTQLAIDSNTASSGNLFDFKPKIQYVSSGFAGDLTTTTIVISFDETKTVSRIAIMETNVKAFDIFFNGVTANAFSLTTTAATTTSQFTNNSESSMYLFTTPQACTSVTLDLKSTFLAGNEKAIGHLYIGDLELEFDRIPSAKNYKIKLITKEVVHKMSSGARRRQVIDENWSANIKYKFITKKFRDELKDVYDLGSDLIFAPFGTSTGWDAVLFNSIWTGPFEFFQHSDDAVNAGFSGSIVLWEAT